MEMRDSNGKIRDSGASTVSTKGAPARPAVVGRDTESGVPNRTTNRDTDVTGAPRMTMTTRADLINLEFYKKAGWAEEAAEVLFKIKARQTTIRSECYYGLVHFISCVFCLAVIPQQLSNAGYDARSTVVATAATCGLGCIICGLFANLPFVLAPPAVIGIFLTNNLQTNNLSPAIGSSAVVISGVVLTTLGYRPLAQLVSKLIPLPIQVGTAVGVGLLTAFAGATDVRLVVKGTNNHLLGLGDITPQVMIAVCGIIIITVSTYYRMKGAFCIALIFCSLVWWISSGTWPSALAAAPYIQPLRAFDNGDKQEEQTKMGFLTADLIFLFVLYLNGLVTSLSDLAGLTRASDHTVPRGRWLYILCGIMTIVAGLFQSAPILISPESAASIKAGAKTGLATVVCGLLFLLSVFFSPVFGAIPHAGTSPVLIMIGVVLFQNVGRIDWRNVVDAAPTFIVLFFIPFTFSIIQGVLLGYSVLGLVWLFTGDLVENAVKLLLQYYPSLEGSLSYDNFTLFGFPLRKKPSLSLAEHDEYHETDRVSESLSAGLGVGQLVLTAEEERQLATINERSTSTNPTTTTTTSPATAAAELSSVLYPTPQHAQNLPQPQTPLGGGSGNASRLIPSGPTRRLTSSQKHTPSQSPAAFPVDGASSSSSSQSSSGRAGGLAPSSSRDNVLTFALGGPHELSASTPQIRNGRDGAYANFISSPLPTPSRSTSQAGAGTGSGAGAGAGGAVIVPAPGSTSDRRGRSSSVATPVAASQVASPDFRSRVLSEGDGASPLAHKGLDP